MTVLTDTPSQSKRVTGPILPVALTGFIGRKREIPHIKKLLRRTRLLTLAGAGGSGKTRLALQIATQLSDKQQFKDGVWWVELAALSNPDFVPQAVASALGLRELPNEPYRETLANTLRAKQLLLVLDNCEHLVTACAHLANDLLTRCPHLTILATSRQALDIGAEQIFQVPPLSLPDSQQALTLRKIARSDAIRLFTGRAQSVQPEFSLTRDNAIAVVQVCRRLDGIPLAIELAATRVRVLAPEQIAARLEDGLDLLTTGSPTALPRHQTLRAALDWSYALLTDKEKILFRRLSVFAGGWTLEAAQAVCSGPEIQPREVLDLLSRLIDKSLVTTLVQAGIARYRFLETIRSYAHTMFSDSQKANEVRERHLDFFIRLAEETQNKQFGTSYISSIERYSVEADNFRAALAWSLGGAAREKGVRLAGALGWFWEHLCYLSEGMDWLRQALAVGAGTSAPVRAYALYKASHISTDLGNFPEAIAFGEQSVALYRELGDKPHFANAQSSLALTLFFHGNTERAIPLVEQSLSLFRELGDEVGTAGCLRVLAVHRQNQGDYEASLPLLEESLLLATKLQNGQRIQASLGSLAHVYRMRGDFVQATLIFNRAMAIRLKYNDEGMLAWGFEFYAILATMQRQAERAARLWGAAYALRKSINFPRFPVQRDYAPYEQEARTLLDAETFAQLFAEGGAMPLLKAAEYAMTAPIPSIESTRQSLMPRMATKLFGGLTAREREIAVLVAQGKPSREIADNLVLSERTVEHHIGNILSKLAFHSRTQIATWVLEQGLSKTIGN